MNRKLLIILVILIILITSIAGSYALFLKDNSSVESVSTASSTININVSNNTLTTSKLNLGVTYMQHNLDGWGDTASINRGKALLGDLGDSQYPLYHAQHIMGFGADNPEPSPGVYNWSSLDNRMNIIKSIPNSKPVITLCCAPDWMKGGNAGSTDWSNLEAAPQPAYYDDFADLSLEVAKRYPEVLHFQVWNEFKGFYDSNINNWDYVGYTKMYNMIYDRLKAFNPNIQIGGPYLPHEGTGSNRGEWYTATPLTDRNKIALEYWLKNKHGGDMFLIDGGVTDYHDPINYSNDEFVSYIKKFESVTKQMRELDGYTDDLEIWWSEDYTKSFSNLDFQAVTIVAMLYYHVLGGTDLSLRWEPQSTSTSLNTSNQNLFTDTRSSGGGQALPNYYVYKTFKDYFLDGTKILQVSNSNPEDVLALASPSKILLINLKNQTHTVNINNSTTVNLNAYEYKIVDNNTRGTGNVCGNGIIETGEVCDDRNTTNNDFCSSDCKNSCNSGSYWNGQTCINLTSTQAVCGAVDTNGDGTVNIFDFAYFAQRLYKRECVGSPVTISHSCGQIDANLDGKISLGDFAVFVSKYKTNCE